MDKNEQNGNGNLNERDNVLMVEEWSLQHQHKQHQHQLYLQPLLQAIKLLTLPKGKAENYQLFLDVCFLLNATQIQKLLTMYSPSDLEEKVSRDLIKNISACVSEFDQLMLDTSSTNTVIVPEFDLVAMTVGSEFDWVVVMEKVEKELPFLKDMK
eukprot:TRINITY_DN1917_c0_g1_i1.p1 TRINITY_DN1917_c0_g1~~TRINITY_DN1917_c0_g1_i1.p1  ORF type:complete len:175 (+),score=51.84 TRINITY_DN1917_c0_g1_i1:61-525(+)